MSQLQILNFSIIDQFSHVKRPETSKDRRSAEQNMNRTSNNFKEKIKQTQSNDDEHYSDNRNNRFEKKQGHKYIFAQRQSKKKFCANINDYTDPVSEKQDIQDNFFQTSQGFCENVTLDQYFQRPKNDIEQESEEEIKNIEKYLEEDFEIEEVDEDKEWEEESGNFIAKNLEKQQNLQLNLERNRLENQENLCFVTNIENDYIKQKSNNNIKHISEISDSILLQHNHDEQTYNYDLKLPKKQNTSSQKIKNINFNNKQNQNRTNQQFQFKAAPNQYQQKPNTSQSPSCQINYQNFKNQKSNSKKVFPMNNQKELEQITLYNNEIKNLTKSRQTTKEFYVNSKFKQKQNLQFKSNLRVNNYKGQNRRPSRKQQKPSINQS